MKNLTNVVSVISGKTKGGVRYGDRHDRLLGETTSVAAPNVQVSVVGNNVTSNEKGDDMVVDEVECVRRFSRVRTDSSTWTTLLPLSFVLQCCCVDVYLIDDI